MNKKSLLLLLVLGLGGAAAAQDTLLEYVTEECQADLDKFCAEVTPGEGRLMYCAAAYQDQLSGQCKGALANAALLMADLSNTIAVVAEACETELMTHCADVEVGEGRVLQCLDDHEAELGAECNEVLDQLVE
ncbi:MAG TPA: hypothetical protein VFY03_04680 [Woeseiaceae bacterium]|nr:hypothetical protein [Woeseiaceae bacterium]